MLAQVRFGDECDTVQLDLGPDGPLTIAEKLGSLQSLAGRPLRVRGKAPFLDGVLYGGEHKGGKRGE